MQLVVGEIASSNASNNHDGSLRELWIKFAYRGW